MPFFRPTLLRAMFFVPMYPYMYQSKCNGKFPVSWGHGFVLIWFCPALICHCLYRNTMSVWIGCILLCFDGMYFGCFLIGCILVVFRWVVYWLCCDELYFGCVLMGCILVVFRWVVYWLCFDGLYFGCVLICCILVVFDCLSFGCVLVGCISIVLRFLCRLCFNGLYFGCLR